MSKHWILSGIISFSITHCITQWESVLTPRRKEKERERIGDADEQSGNIDRRMRKEKGKRGREGFTDRQINSNKNDRDWDEAWGKNCALRGGEGDSRKQQWEEQSERERWEGGGIRCTAYLVAGTCFCVCALTSASESQHFPCGVDECKHVAVGGWKAELW